MYSPKCPTTNKRTHSFHFKHPARRTGIDNRCSPDRLRCIQSINLLSDSPAHYRKTVCLCNVKTFCLCNCLKASKPGRDRRLMSQLPAVHLVYLHLPKCQYNPINSLRKCPRSSARQRASLSLTSAVAQEVGTPRWRERAALASPKRSPRWPCLGGETDGAVPLKAQHQPTTRPTPPSTRHQPHPHTYAELFMCPAKSDKGPFEVQVRRMMVAFTMEAA